MAFLDMTVNFIIKELKSKHLVFVSDSLETAFFEGTRKHFTHSPGQNLLTSELLAVFIDLIRRYFDKKDLCTLHFALFAHQCTGFGANGKIRPISFFG